MNLITTEPSGAILPLQDNAGGFRSTDTERLPLIRQYLIIALRWRYVILGTVIASVLLALIITLLMTPKFTSTAEIEILRESDRVTNFESVARETSVADQEFYQTQYGLLHSRSLAERVAVQLGLVDDPQFYEMFNGRTDKSEFQLVNGSYSAAGRPARKRAAGKLLLENLVVSPVRLSRLVDINFTSPSATLSAKVANSWAKNFIETNLERKLQSTAYGRNLLQQQLSKFKERLDASQRQLVAYASAQQIINLPSTTANNGKTTSERPILVDDLALLNEALNKSVADRIEAEARYRKIGGSGASTEALANPAINTLRQRRAELSAERERVLTQFKPEYPAATALQAQIADLTRAIDREEGRVSSSLRADFQSAVQRESSLKAKVAQLKSSYLDLRARSIQYNIYQQEVDTNRALYDGLLQRFKEIGVAGGVGVNNVSIVDPADVPQRPSSPRILLNFGIALLIGLTLGVGLAIVLDQVDETINSPADLENRLGLSQLGWIPKLANANPMEALSDRKSDMVDAYLSVYTNLGFTTANGVPRVFSVASTRPSEGKSTTAMALAIMLARVNRKVILLDGDMRSPSLHLLCGLPLTKGLSNFLSGDDHLNSIVTNVGDLGISLMSAGPPPPNAAELLAGERLSILIERLLETYDNIVIDSPPVMGLADAPIIGSSVEGVLYVVESNGTRSATIRAALERLVSANVRVLGGVLTKFEAQKSGYGYGYGYGYQYSYGYGRNDRLESQAS